MKKEETNKSEEMQPEYDFSKGVRGKHHRAYQQGHRVKVEMADGSVVEQHFTLEEGAVMLEPDVREYFKDSESVNRALRVLISIRPRKGRREAAK